MQKTVDIFLGYAVEDKELCLEVKKRLKWLEREGLIRTWHEYMISPGMEKEHEILRYLEMAHLILLFVSAEFIDSDLCYDLELEHAMKRHEQGDARVIPIILRSISWKETPIGKLQALPRGDKPVKRHLDLDEVLMTIGEDIHRVIRELLAKQYIQEGHSFLQEQQYEKTLEDCNHALHFLPDSRVTYNIKGLALLALKRYDEALNAYDEAIRLGHQTASAYKERGDALYHLQRYNDALLSYKEAISLQFDFVDAYKGASQALRQLAQENFRLAEFYDEQARKLSQDVRNSSQEVSE